MSDVTNMIGEIESGIPLYRVCELNLQPLIISFPHLAVSRIETIPTGLNTNPKTNG
jgi:hypothetical protein